MELLEVNAFEAMKAFMAFDKAEIHARSARGAGATKQEIAEAVLIAATLHAGGRSPTASTP